jgi:hypothetical protein
MNFEALHDSRFVKYLSTAHLIHFVLFGVVPTALGIISGLNIPDQPLEIKVLCGFAVALLVYLAILFVLMRWEKYQEKQEESLPMAQRTYAVARVGHKLWNRSKKNFKYALIICPLIYLAVWAFSISYYPRLKLSQPPGVRYGIDHIIDLPQPNTSVVFEKIRIVNNGSQSITQNWTLTATVPSDETLTGKPAWNDQIYAELHFTVFGKDLIYLKTANNPIARGALIEGPAVFVFPGVSNETLRAPGTKLVLSCEDSTGTKVKLEQRVTAQELILPRY